MAVGLLGAGAGVASANTFYVNNRSGEDTNECQKPAPEKGKPGVGPCATIKGAVKRAEEVVGPNTIELSAEGPGPFSEYNEAVALEKAQDAGLTINGEEPGVEIKVSGKDAVVVGPAAGSVTFSNVKIQTTGAPAAVRDVSAGVKLVNDLVELESGENGVEAAGHGALTIEGGSVIMESDSGNAVSAKEAALTVSGATLVNGNGGIGSESGGIYGTKGTLAVSSTTVIIEGSPKTTQFGIVAEHDTATSIQNSVVKQGGPSIGVILEGAPPAVNGLRVEMLDPSAVTEGVLEETEGGSSTYSHLEVSGTWAGPAMAAFGGDVTLSDSHLSTNGSSESAALKYQPVGATRGLLVQRTVLKAGPKAKPGTLVVAESNATIDSTEILGGTDGVAFENTTGGVRTLTIDGSTIGPNPGISFEAPGVVGVGANAHGSMSSTAKVAIEGSILLESQLATTANGGNESSVTCTYSAVPSQIQSPNAIAGHGAIACASGVSGNTNSSAEATPLFAEPLKNYSLSPTSSAIDSVPAGAITLPFAITPSPTDLVGNPRSGDGHNPCFTGQDKGALELQGNLVLCPGPVVAKPLAGVISSLSFSPDSFLPAPSGATISRAKKKYGTKVSYLDSQVATTTFTVMRQSSGRKQGKSCKRPSKKNRHGKRCTILTKVGKSFTHTDRAGLNSFHFSGRIAGRKLAAAVYELEAVAHDAAGNGKAVMRAFTIR